ncbi:Major facilitator superfamily domain-containing protein 12 [Armadillidium nasatum]|uniref:Major facilitator superfamily domain-containing protein 12 n=1 Tax=Armadillidium nasatum TaxID=96803 RepID=A0A5N5SPA5_9CRUS|nr:Major facilitator superfamily domain-containing protein 12 [Armadillidium nasatum]
MTLTFKVKYGYGVGHILNDLCSAIWFSYLLLYFHHVLLFPSALAGVVLLIGQIADALSTPFVGHEADRTDDLPFCIKYGRRKTWHLIGTLSVLSSFAFIFLGCFGCTEMTSPWARVLYFSPFVIVFQFGWACTQISHLAILPNLSSDPNDRTELNAIRYGFTVVSTIAVYCITWLVLGLTSSTSSTSAATKDVLSPKDELKFVTLVFIILGIGAVFALIFHLMVKEKNDSYLALEDETQEKPRRLMVWKDWLREPQFFQVALIYMATRLYCNLTQAYMPIYLEDTLLLDEKSIAYIPLVMYVAGFTTTTVMKPLNRIAGRKITFLIGCAIGAGGVVWVFFGQGPLYRTYYIYLVAILMGSGASTMLVTVLSLSADMIGNNIECGAFVYGSLSFTDKLSNGLVVMIIQYFSPCLFVNKYNLMLLEYAYSI